MHTGITGTTRTFSERPYTVYPQRTSTHSKHFHKNHTQTYSELFHQTIHRHTRQTDPLTEQHIQYLPPPNALVQVMAYADDITITSTHTNTSLAKKYIQPYLHNVLPGQNKESHTKSSPLFSPDPAEYTSNLDLIIHNNALPIATHSKVLGFTLDPKLTYSTHIHKPLQIIKSLTATGWGKQKETLMANYKAVMRPALEYASSIWSPLASLTSINKLRLMQNATLRTAT